jgi:hypothetical protein
VATETETAGTGTAGTAETEEIETMEEAIGTSQEAAVVVVALMGHLVREAGVS